jgi:hypothetical protein
MLLDGPTIAQLAAAIIAKADVGRAAADDGVAGPEQITLR